MSGRDDRAEEPPLMIEPGDQLARLGTLAQIVRAFRVKRAKSLSPELYSVTRRLQAPPSAKSKPAASRSMSIGHSSLAAGSDNASAPSGVTVEPGPALTVDVRRDLVFGQRDRDGELLVCDHLRPVHRASDGGRFRLSQARP